MKYKVFVDSDVVVSAAISFRGAAFLLLNQGHISLELYISDFSYLEIKDVVKRLALDLIYLDKLVFKYTHIFYLGNKIEEEVGNFEKYVKDLNDAHIVMAAVLCKARFILSYNLKDYSINKIKNDFGIIVYTPAQFLQYLRSQDVNI